MKIFVINLDSRKDRLDFISKQLNGFEWARFPAIDGSGKTRADFIDMGFDVYSSWVDPLLNRPLTDTEVACAISHFKVWEKCIELNENVLVLEDDVELCGKLDSEKVDLLMKTTDLLYLDHREMFPDNVVECGEYFVPYYPYLGSAYVITPTLAERLINSSFKSNLIPLDEFLPMVLGVDYDKFCLSNREITKNNFKFLKSVLDIGEVSALAVKDKVFKQLPRSVMGSNIESGKRMSDNESYNVHTITVGTDESKMKHFMASAKQNNIKYTNLGKDVEWKGGDMTAPGGGMKINLVKKYLETTSDNDIVFFCDGYDVVINDDMSTIVERFIGFEADVLVAAEKTCWPDSSLAPNFSSHTEYKYPNSGLYIGYARALKKMFSLPIKDSDDDQKYLQIAMLTHDGIKVELDKENYLFQCYSGAEEDLAIKSNGQFVNYVTKCCPCVIHGNGGTATKDKFFNFVAPIVNFSTSIIDYLDPGPAKTVANDIIQMDFLSPEMCEKLIQLAENAGGWESLYGDKFPGQEKRIREISVDLFNELEQNLKKKHFPVIESYWKPTLMYGLRDAFVIKYSPDTQASLALHNDASMVSGIVKLNSTYTGGETFFPRQNFSNINTEVGKMIWWPGQVTHGHEGRKVTSGTKYSLVIWTSRMKGDINY